MVTTYPEGMKVRAAVQVGDGAIEVRQLDAPDVPPPGGALLRVEGSGMCGSDVEQYHGMTRRMGLHDYPVIPGHEIVGRIATIGDGARQRWGVDVGSRVAVHGMRPCGACEGCLAARSCTQTFSYGFHSSTGGPGLWGGYAEVLELTPSTVLVPMPEHVSIQDAVFFNPLAAGFDWGVRVAGTQPGDTVLVLGSGQRGIACLIAALEAGAAQVIVTGLARDRAKLDLALEFGASAALIDGVDDIPAAVRNRTGGAGADRVIDTTPLATEPVLTALEAAARGAVIVLGGLKDKNTVPSFPVDLVIRKTLHVVGVLSASTAAVERAVDTIATGRYPLHRLHSHTLGLDQVGWAIELLGGEREDATPVMHVTVVP